MAVSWQIVKLPTSTSEDLSHIEAELADREENSWDLEHVTVQDGFLILFFKQKE